MTLEKKKSINLGNGLHKDESYLSLLNVEFNKTIVEGVPCSGIRLKMLYLTGYFHKIGEE